MLYASPVHRPCNHCGDCVLPQQSPHASGKPGLPQAGPRRHDAGKRSTIHVQGEQSWPTAASSIPEPRASRPRRRSRCMPRAGRASWRPASPSRSTTARDLSLAYSPGVAEPCLHIARDPALAYDYTTKGNMVAVISNGTAVLGLGNLGARRLEAGDGRQGRAVQALRRHRRHRPRRSTPRTSTSSSTAVRFLGPASAASTWRTSRRRNASSSSSGCAS